VNRLRISRTYGFRTKQLYPLWVTFVGKIVSVVYPSRFRCRASVVLVLVLAAAALGCDDDGGTGGPIGPGGGGQVPIGVSGTWSGSATDAIGQFQMILTLTQTGINVTGTMRGTNAVGAPIYNNGTVSGQATANTFVFTINVPRGGIVDAPDCSASFAATTTDLLSTSMAGNYTGGDTCGNTFVGGRFQLIKQ
jgi:hypothetical protein